MTIASSNSLGNLGPNVIDNHPAEPVRTGKTVSTTLTPDQISQIMKALSAPAAERQLVGLRRGNDGVTNSSGAPALYVPTGRPDMASRILEMQILGIESQQETSDLTKNNLEANIDKQDKLNKKTLQNLKESQDKQLEASHSSRLGKIFGWIGKVVAVVAAVVSVAVTGAAAVLSGGAAVPLLALSVVGLVSATMSLANQVSKELGGPEISLSNLISSVSVKLLEAFGVDEDEAAKIGKVLVGAAAIALPILAVVEPQMLGTTAEGICLLAGVSPETAATVSAVVGVVAAVTVGIMVTVATSFASGGLSVLPSAVKLANSIIQSASAVVKGSTMFAGGAMNIDSAVKTRDLGVLQAKGKDLQTTTQALRQVMKDQQETLSSLLEQTQNSMKQIATLIKELFDSLSQISNNLGRTQSA